jgi:hypothetical protein
MEPDADYQVLHEADSHFCEQLTSLVEIIGTLPLSGTLESFYRRALDLARERLGFETVALRFRPTERKRLSREARGFLVSGGETGDCGEKGRSPDAPAARRRTRWSESPTTAVVPIFDAETSIGQIRIENRRSGKPLTRQQRELLRLFALALGCLHTRKRIETEREKTIEDLQAAIARINTLHGLLPICCSCKKIRQDDGYWSQIEEYLQAHSDATFSHGICPECAQKLYPEVYERQCRKKELRLSSVEESPVSVGEPVIGSLGENPEDPPETTGND